MRYLYSCRALFVLHEAELCNKGSRSGRERGVGRGLLEKSFKLNLRDRRG